MIIGISGLISAGKDTMGDFLVQEHNFKKESFAGILKDITAILFEWDREMLEGGTRAAREEREQIDNWWADNLEIENFSPRLALQLLGTEVFRENFHNNIWILALANKIRHSDDDVVITDARFPNELKMIKVMGGTLVNIHRGNAPKWFTKAKSFKTFEEYEQHMKTEFPEVHASEYSWARCEFDIMVDNNGSIEDLRHKVDTVLQIRN